MAFWRWGRRAEAVPAAGFRPPPPLPPAPPPPSERLHFGVLVQAAYHGSAAYVAELADALAAAAPERWVELDRRVWLPYAPAETLDERRAVGRATVEAAPTPLALVLAALDGNGFVREAATARLPGVEPRLALPALALRCADPVVPVRTAARELAAAVLRDEAAAALPLLAPVAYALRARAQGGWLVERLESLLRDGDAAVLEAALAVPDNRARRAFYAVAIGTGRLPVERLLAAARSDRDPELRRVTGAAVIETARAAGDVALLRPLLRASSAYLRAGAVWAFGEAGDPRPATEALPDRAASVREVAQAVVRRAGDDPATAYRLLLAAGPPPTVPAGAVAGLGETGETADAAAVRPFLRAPRPRVRAAAVRALRRLGAVDVAELLPLLLDAPVVTRAVVLALDEQPPAVAALRPLLRTDAPAHTRWAAYRLLRERGAYERLLTDLTLAADTADPLHETARSDLRAWLRDDAATAYQRPAGEPARVLERALRDAAPALTGDELRRLRFHLGLPG